MERERDRCLIHIQHIVQVPSLQLQLHDSNEVLGIRLRIHEVFLNRVHRTMIRETNASRKAMYRQLLRSARFFLESRKKATGLLHHHPIGDLNCLLTKFERESSKLILDLRENTFPAWVDLERSASRVVCHKLRAGVQLVRFFNDLLPMRVVHWVDANGSTSFVTTTEFDGNESNNLLDDLPFAFELVGLPA